MTDNSHIISRRLIIIALCTGIVLGLIDGYARYNLFNYEKVSVLLGKHCDASS